MSERKMATIRRIGEVKNIEGADKICAYRVDGWWIVDSVNKFKENDLVIYAEPDSWIPNSVAPFLTKIGYEPKEYNGIKGERLRTIKLKKQISQGLLLPLSVLDHIESELFEGLDVSYPLNITKWEPPIDVRLAGNAKGNFPYFIPKTDQERIQNMKKEFAEFKTKGSTWEKTEKLHGSSMTIYLKDGEFGVCSRNLELKQEEGNTFWDIAIRDSMQEKMLSIFWEGSRNFAIQGELCGPGINGNTLKLNQHEFFVFDVFDIDKQQYLLPEERVALISNSGFKHVPVVGTNISLNQVSIEEVIEDANGASTMADTKREGFVYKAMQDRSLSFKVISPEWLLKNE